MLPLSYPISILLSIHPGMGGERHPCTGGQPVLVSVVLPEAQVEEDQLRHAARAALGDLSERHRAAIVLTYYEELPNSMAADALELNLKAFESLLLRARGAMRAALMARGLTSLTGEIAS